jgi:hypothetical protein
VLICDYSGNYSWPSPKLDGVADWGGPATVPVPEGVVRPAGPPGRDADGHMVLFDASTLMAYDFWQATTFRDGECASRGGGLIGSTIIEAGAIELFDLRGPGINLDRYSSARATGVPLLAGLILPEDIEQGEIAHALVYAIPGPRNISETPEEPLRSDYFYPATTTEVFSYNTNPQALAAGQRIRLKKTLVDEEGNRINEKRFAPITRLFLTALRTYGAYLVDNAGGFVFSAEDIHTASLNLPEHEIRTLIGAAPGTPLPAGKTKWQIVMDQLSLDLELIPFAYGPWSEGQDPATAQIITANFEVIQPADQLRQKEYLPFILD